MGKVGIIALVVVLAIVGIAVYTGIQETRKSGGGFFTVLQDERVSKESREGGATSGFVLRRGDPGVSSGVAEPRVSSGFELRKYQGAGEDGSSQVSSKNLNLPAVIISSVRRPGSPYERTDVSISAGYTLKEPVNITGWKIRTDSGGEVSIPKGIRDYTPGVSREVDIVLRPGEKVSLYGHYKFAGYQHPFGKSILLNACTGYLNDVYKFDPELPRRCPILKQADVVSLSGGCQATVLSLPRCSVPTSAQIQSFQGDSSCQSFLRDKFGYANCYTAHRQDDNFFSGEWYVWLDTRIPLAEDHDRVLLLDATGAVVDEFVY
ncbi:MAG: hypothetical protein Q7J22_00175 [Candidatus Wolfebacteria bacterium]|nr:hypothetical protein [Candidatus Wolfebacteria bacterium]